MMKMEKLVGERFKERPSDCLIDSHALMVRGGYMKYVASGIFSLNTPLRRITRKIEEIIRQEMDAIDGQEVLFPVVLPATLWEESGRFSSVGSELMRMRDRGGSALVLGMTHEEAAVQLVREYGSSYLKYPFMVYQIQTKFRDEARPRGGLIRVREFTMKDAYSFHTSQEDLEQYYQRCFRAYERIFARAGLKNVISVAADSGLMGGNASHEFMLLTSVGEDSIAICEKCGYSANMEAAPSITTNRGGGEAQALQLVHTPGAESILDVCAMLQLQPDQACKAVVYQKNANDEYVIVFIRGDLEVNETKLRNLVGEELHPAKITEESGICAGFIGPHGLEGEHTCLFDRSLLGASGLVCGANQADHHFTGLNMARDCGGQEYFDLSKITNGGICPQCHEAAIKIERGIEVGNIFQLGTKYTKAMHMLYQDAADRLQNPVMGCYGIGVGRLAASVCEESHDERGPIWPMAIAPWQVQLCCLRADDQAVKAMADELYAQMQAENIEVLYDERSVSAGVMFSDADLMGIPLRVVVSPRNQAKCCVEISARDKSFTTQVAISALLPELKARIAQQLG